MGDEVVFGYFQITEYRPCGADAAIHLFNSESFEGRDFKMFFQFVPGGIPFEKPLLDGIHVEFISEQFFETSVLSSGVYNLFGLEAVEQFVYYRVGAFRCQKFARRQIQQR